MSVDRYLTSTVAVYRPVLHQNKQTNPNLPETNPNAQWTEDRPRTPVAGLEKVRVSIEPITTIDQFLFGRLSNPANYELGHKAQNMFKMEWRTEDIHEYDLVKWSVDGKFYLIQGRINDTLRKSRRQQFCLLKEHTLPY